MPCFMKKGKSDPFKLYHFAEVVSTCWWSFAEQIDHITLNTAQRLHTSIASCTGVERIFSTFGVVLTNVLNVLGNEEAGGSVTIF